MNLYEKILFQMNSKIVIDIVRNDTNIDIYDNMVGLAIKFDINISDFFIKSFIKGFGYSCAFILVSGGVYTTYLTGLYIYKNYMFKRVDGSTQEINKQTKNQETLTDTLIFNPRKRKRTLETIFEENEDEAGLKSDSENESETGVGVESDLESESESDSDIELDEITNELQMEELNEQKNYKQLFN